MPPETVAQTPATDANNQPAPAVASAPAAAPSTLLTDAPAAPAAAAPAAQPTQPAGDKPAEGEQKAEAKPEGAPEQYADFTLPEGLTFNSEVLDDFKAIAKERNLSQEDAQKFTDLGAKLIQQSQTKTLEQIEATQAQWAEAASTDKEFGGDKLTENMAIANKALSTFGSPELTKMLSESKLGNHPEIIRAFYRVGKAISEDKLVAGATKPANAESDLAKKMYPTMTN